MKQEEFPDDDYMDKIKTFSDLQKHIEKNDVYLIYLSSPNCSICHADLPRVEELVREMNFPAAQVDISEVPEAAGQLSIFTAPVVLLFYKGKEYSREARIIDFAKLEKRMRELASEIIEF